MRFHNSVLKHGQGKQTEFTIDFTSYKVLIIMLMADLCNIVIYIINVMIHSVCCIGVQPIHLYNVFSVSEN